MIVKDDENTIGPLLEKLRPHVDQICISDTGSTDATPSICKKWADRFDYFLDANDPATELIEDFALARQHVLEMATNPVHLWIDGDDDFQGAEHIRALCNRPEESFMLLVPYEYSHDAEGRCTCLHWRETIVKPRDKCKWQIPVHEVLIPSVPMQVTESANQLRRIHRKHLSKRAPDPQRNLRILDKYVGRVGETDVRALYYYGVELHHAGRVGDAIRILKRYVQLADSPTGWADERCLAMLELARIYQTIGDLNDAIDWALKAIVTKSWPEPYWLIGSCFFTMAQRGQALDYNCKRAIHFIEQGLSMPDAQTLLFVNPMERHYIKRQLSLLYLQMGRVENARDAAKAGLDVLPGDQILATAYLQAEDMLTKNSMVRDAQKLRQCKDQLTAFGLYDAPQWEAFGNVLTQTLGLAPQLPPPQSIESHVAEQLKADGCLDLVFYLGQAFERWNPVTLAKGGMGGSETMAWELARRLRGLGHRVRVFADCSPELEGVFDGVEWLQSSKYVGATCDVLIAERRPDAVDDAAQLTSRANVLHIHDVHCGDGLTQQRALRIDRILALSQWHKRYLLQTYSRANGAPYPIASLHPDDVHVTRNGIDFARFDADAPRNPKRVVYSSSPDRGLTTLLEMWPAILADEPEAELHVYYGLGGWEASIGANPAYNDSHPFLSATALRRLKHQLRTVPRVTMHGRINQVELAREFLQSGVLAYPSWFSETSMIGAMEAQAAGLYIVTTPIAALNETVGDRGVRVPGGWDTNDGATMAERKEFVDAVVKAIRGEGQPRTRSELQDYARENFSLDALAAEWDRELRELVESVEETVVPRFRNG